MSRIRRNNFRVNAVAIAELMIGLQDGCHTMIELSEISGLAIATVRNYCKQLHKRGAVHIADWREDSNGGRTLKVYELGIGKDMPKPLRRSNAEACARWQAKQRQQKVLHMMAANTEDFRSAA